MDCKEVAGKLKVLGHPDRLRILEYLHDHQGVDVESMASALSLRQSTTSQHLHILRDAGLVTFEERGGGIGWHGGAGRKRYYSLCFPDLPTQLPALVGVA